MVAAALIGAVAGWLFPAYQHNLYSEPDFRAAPASGNKLLALRIFCALAAAGCMALALRPDHYSLGPALLTAAFLLVLVGLSSTDFERRRLPNRLTYPAAIAAVAICWAWPDRSVTDIAIGAGLGTAAAALLVVLRFGGGDSKLVILIGLLVGWPAIMSALLYGIIGGGLVAAGLLLRRGRRAKFAYGPYLAAGAAIVMLFPQLG